MSELKEIRKRHERDERNGFSDSTTLRRTIHKDRGWLLQRIKELEAEKLALQEFAIWMTGCGYDFCQHEYFCQQRDKLLKEQGNE